MRIVHRITLNSYADPDGFSAIERLGIRHQLTPLPGGSSLVVFEIDEADPRWPEVMGLVRARSWLDLVDTVFAEEEVLQAKWLRLVPRHFHGYPHPKDDMAWKRIVYEGKCPQCGIGFRQRAPFRLAKEPRLGKHDFMSLFWTHTLFCTQGVVDTLEAEAVRGYEVWPAVIHGSGQPSQVVSQLVISGVARPALAKSDRQQPERCWRCWKTKYAFHLRGYMHLQRKGLRPDVDMQLTNEWFGSGRRDGYREILVSNRVAKVILENRWRGVQLKPVKLI